VVGAVAASRDQIRYDRVTLSAFFRGAQAYRVLYTSTLDDGEPAVASGIVIAAEDLPPGPRPVIAWAHGTTGVAEGCAPSLLNDPFGAGATPALAQVIANGWVMVATDYAGLSIAGPHPYLIGQAAGRSVLDSVRAAHQLDGLVLEDQTEVWGHSQAVTPLYGLGSWPTPTLPTRTSSGSPRCPPQPISRVSPPTSPTLREAASSART
jgi:hypothetical protein